VPFKPGPDPNRARGRAGAKNRRTVEIETFAKALVERRGGLDGLLGRFLDSDDPAVGFRAVQLLLGYAYGTPCQRVSFDGAAAAGVLVLRWGSTDPGDPAAAALPDAAGDRD
jgi:hypothetical protein